MPLDELYKDIILDHYEYPRNKGSIEGTACTCAGGDNPICGDSFDVCILLDNDHVEAIAFEGRGCAISQASASMMTEAVEGKAVAEVRRWYRTVHGLLTNRPDEVDTELDIGDLGSARRGAAVSGADQVCAAGMGGVAGSAAAGAGRRCSRAAARCRHDGVGPHSPSPRVERGSAAEAG